MYENIENMRSNMEPPTPTKFAKFIRIVNIATAALIIAFGLVGLIYNAINSFLSFRFFLIFSPIFVMIFGAALLLLELKPELILQNFGFLRSLLGRGVFNVYLSTQVYYYFSCSSNNGVLAWVSAMVLFALGILYIILHYTVAKNGYAGELRTELN